MKCGRLLNERGVQHFGEQMGVVERVPDPGDGRAKLIRFVREGDQPILMRGMAVLGELEAQIEAEIGARPMKQLHRTLLATEGWLAEETVDG